MLPRFVLCLAAVLIAGPALAQSAPLPDDREQYHLVVLTADQPTTAGAALLAQLQSDPQLAKIASLCATHRLTTSSELYRQRYASALPSNSLPAIALVRADGGVIYKASGGNLPSSGAEIAEALVYYGKVDKDLRTGGGTSWDAARTQDCPGGQCPMPQLPRPFGPSGPLNPDSWIPDTVTVQPTVNMPSGTVGMAIGGVVVLILFCGGALLLIAAIAGVILYARGRPPVA